MRARPSVESPLGVRGEGDAPLQVLGLQDHPTLHPVGNLRQVQHYGPLASGTLGEDMPE